MSSRYFLLVTIAVAMSACVRAEDNQYAGIEPLVTQAIAAGETPGAVVVVADRSEILYQRAFGDRQVEPTREPMTLETVFDLASITKPVATATSVMKLVDAGKIDVNAAVANYLPEFAAHGKDTILVSDLLLHIGGLIPDNALSDYQDGTATAWQRICELKPIAERTKKFAYTDVGFIVLGKLVERVSGRTLDEYARAEIYAPLGMTETMFNPAADLRQRAAATEQRDGHWMKGEVHDPRAYLLGGVAGHAGLFSTAGDLVKYGRAMLASKQAEGVLSAQTFQLMTTPREIPRGTRTYGWDNLSPYSKNRGDNLSNAAFGHGGFTGTVLWIDPEKDLIFIFLGSRLHPDGKGAVNGLAGKIATLIAADQ
jgi:CubicO group peptidase (beta-lactamase class C family)